MLAFYKCGEKLSAIENFVDAKCIVLKKNSSNLLFFAFDQKIRKMLAKAKVEVSQKER